eukprot:gene16592-biopygen8267
MHLIMPSGGRPVHLLMHWTKHCPRAQRERLNWARGQPAPFVSTPGHQPSPHHTAVGNWMWLLALLYG